MALPSHSSTPIPSEIAEKLVYAVAAIDRVRALTPLLHADHERRMIGKAAFLFIDSAIALIPRLNNLVQVSAPRDRQDVKDVVRSTREDYEAHFAAVRDKMTAHRQEQPPFDELRDWRNIQDDYIAYLRDDIAEAYSLIRGRDPSLSELTAVQPFSGAEQAAISAATTPTGGLFFDVSAQRIASGGMPTAILGGPNARGQDVLAANDVLQLLATLVEVLSLDREYGVLLRILYLTEAITFFDVLFDDQSPNPGRREPSFRDELIAHADATASVKILKSAALSLHAGVRDRALRNRFAAHLDVDTPLASLVAEAISYDWPMLSDSVGAALDAFYQACKATFWLRPLLVHRQQLRGAIGMINNDPAPQYES